MITPVDLINAHSFISPWPIQKPLLNLWKQVCYLQQNLIVPQWCSVAAPEIGGHQGDKMHIWRGKNQKKNCREWLIVAIFSFWWRGASGGTVSDRGKFSFILCPPWCRHWRCSFYKSKAPLNLWKQVLLSSVDSTYSEELVPCYTWNLASLSVLHFKK